MRVYLEATQTIYECITVTCSQIDRDGFNQVYFKVAEGLTLIVDMPVGNYDKLVIPRLLKDGYFRISESYRHKFVCTV